MDFTLSSSTVLGAAVVLWLLWGAPYLLRRLRPAGETGLLMAAANQDDDEAALAPSSVAGSQRTGTATAKPAQANAMPARRSPEEGKHVTDQTPAPSRLRIRWGRCALAGLGLLGLVVAVIGGVLSAFQIASGAVPLGGLAVLVVSVATLRRLAVGDRRRRLDAAFRSAMTTAPASSLQVPEAPRREATEVFDHQPVAEPAPAPLNRDQLRAAALEVARAAQKSAAEAASREGVADADPWEPVEVPKPAYMESAKADREAPEPFERPEQPKPEGKVTLKPKPETEDVPGVPTVPSARPAGRGALGNLDAVLQRRRA
ncbi:hypothetical protein [Sinomonas humi]|uniref:Uncharacterized protein n=1 Tax=Sinomonas humi TaxID=1338436 RepID=A0A0B2AII6_9MICC|nr:hypothetical protein [Sinomonas humi]KHL01552.1 hypothetical protein LK10_14865 [Sinomonas humi]